MNRPETERFLSSLKDFQRDTVDYVFARMYEQPSPAMRFLVADEVGLGKTKVAAGVVARAIDKLRATDPAMRIDVIYICSNAAIARQNIARLNVTGQPTHDLPDRITLLPRDIHRIQKNKVNFIAFTPGTSLSMRSSGGKAEERALLFWLLPDDWRFNKKGALSLLTGGMDRERFKGQVEDLTRRYEIDESLKKAFRESIEKDPQDPAQSSGSLKQRFITLSDQLGGRERLTDDERRDRNSIVGKLRSTLAAVCIESLEPDLVILDEFQRFSDLLHGEDEASQLAQQLFRYPKVRVLLLSATPYRMFTTADDADADGHYEDLIQTIRFLQNDPEQTTQFQKALASYGRELLRIGMDDGQQLRAARDEVAATLRRIMVRTERLAVTADRSGMLKEVPSTGTRLVESDLDSFLAVQGLARSIQIPDIMEYWKSAPYLLNFMDDYDLKRKFLELSERKTIAADVFDALTDDCGALLSKDDISAYRQLDPGNARLRNLMHDMLDTEAWRLLWMPPSWHYYETEGEFTQPISRTLTKRLIFSSWQIVPKVVASLLTYEAERRMLGIDPEGEPGSQSVEARRRRRGLLRFAQSEGRLTGMPVLGLLYPSFTLATEIDPRGFAPADPEAPRPSLSEVLQRASSECRRLLHDITASGPTDGEIDESWYWAAPILLDLNRDDKNEKAWFGQSSLALQWRGEEETSAEDEETVDEVGADAWAAHVRQARELVTGSMPLGRPPDDLAEVLAAIAVGGPAVVALRALARVTGGMQRATDIGLRNQAAQIAEAFRSLFNHPEVTVMLRRVNGEEPFWRRVLEYCARGELQSVLDEYAHVLVEHLGVSGRPAAQIERQVSGAMKNALTLRTATLAADIVELDREGKRIRIEDKMRFRTRFAVRYGARGQEETRTIARATDVQAAFNSPFWPFVLCSTSVGQEGLDFHLYCHAVMHWNLPSNPVDLEQREGRIHRYKGHAVRKNVARDHASRATHVSSGPDSDSWRQLFEAARSGKPDSTSDLVPFWVYTTEGGAHIERHLPMIALSKDVGRAELLRQSLAVYRMAFGQSRQDDLVSYLQRYLTPDQIESAVNELRIDLSPDPSPLRTNSGVAQDPGELALDEGENVVPGSIFNLADFENLLNEFERIRPRPKMYSAEEFSLLLDDFMKLRNLELTEIS